MIARDWSIAPAKLVCSPNTENPVQIHILKIDDDDSDDIVIIDPDQASRPRNNEGGAQIRELSRPNVPPGSTRSRSSRAMPEEESSRGHQCT